MRKVYGYILNLFYTVTILTRKPLAVRVPVELEKEIKEITKIEKSYKSAVVRKLLETGIEEWRKRIAINFLRKGKLSFAKAAEFTKLSLWEFADLIKQSNVEWVSYEPEEIEAEFEKAWQCNYRITPKF